MEIFWLVFYFIIILPFLIAQEGVAMFKSFMNKKKLWWAVPHFLILVLGILLVILWSKGYR